MSAYIALSIEIEVPDAGNDEYMDTLIDDLTCEASINNLRSGIRKWAKLISGLPCHVEATVD